MEERIDELAFAAGIQQHKYWDPKHPDLEGWIVSQDKLDKFAELVINECATVCLAQRDPKNDGYSADLKTAVAAMKRHFGI